MVVSVRPCSPLPVLASWVVSSWAKDASSHGSPFMGQRSMWVLPPTASCRWIFTGVGPVNPLWVAGTDQRVSW